MPYKLSIELIVHSSNDARLVMKSNGLSTQRFFFNDPKLAFTFMKDYLYSASWNFTFGHTFDKED